MDLINTKKGFTLMEILAVLLVLAVIASAAAPVFRAVRYEIRNAQAKAALKKLAEASRSYYQSSRGSSRVFGGEFDARNVNFANAQCGDQMATGIPGQSVTSSSSYIVPNVADLFACGFLTEKDFRGLPYRFVVCNPNVTPGRNPICTLMIGASDLKNASQIYAVAWGNDEKLAGKKYYKNSSTLGYKDGYVMYVGSDMRVHDTNPED